MTQPSSAEQTEGAHARQRDLYERHWSAGRQLDFADRYRQGEMRPFLVARGRVLDVGCGDRALSRGFPHLDIVGVDLARSGGPDACAVAEALPFRSATFDAVVISEVLEHVGSPAQAMAECRRVLRPGGLVVVTVPVATVAFPEAVYRRRKFGVWPSRGAVDRWDPEHERRFDPDELASVVTDAGFRIEHRGSLFGPVVTGLMYFVEPRSGGRFRRVFEPSNTVRALDHVGPFQSSALLVVATAPS